MDATVEQNQAINNQSDFLSILILAYDVDIADDINIQINPAHNGKSTLSPQVRDVILVSEDCSLNWNARSIAWNTLRSDLWSGVSPVKLPIPCNLDPLALAPGVEWAIMEILYSPDDNFYGIDTIKVCTAVCLFKA